MFSATIFTFLQFIAQRDDVNKYKYYICKWEISKNKNIIFIKNKILIFATLATILFIGNSCSKDDDGITPPSLPECNESGLPINIENNCIVYKTYDNNIIELKNSDVFAGAVIVSNTYSDTDGFGTILFDSEVEVIEDDAFKNCYNLISMVIPNSVKIIGGNAFYDCDELTSITIPNSVFSIGEYAFFDCGNLINIYAESATPPDASDNIIYWFFYNPTLYVPTGSKTAYEITYPWDQFSNIVEMDF